MKCFVYLKLQSADQYIVENQEESDKHGITMTKYNDHIVLLSKEDDIKEDSQ